MQTQKGSLEQTWKTELEDSHWEWGARMPHLQEGPGPRLQDKGCFGGSHLQPVENVYHKEFRQREEAGGYKRPEAETCMPGWNM